MGGAQLATAHLQQTAKNINIIPTGQLNNTSVVSGPAPPPPPPPPTNQQNKSVLRKSQRTCSSATGTANQSLNNSLSAAKESSGNKVITRIEHTNFEMPGTIMTSCVLRAILKFFDTLIGFFNKIEWKR